MFEAQLQEAFFLALAPRAQVKALRALRFGSEEKDQKVLFWASSGPAHSPSLSLSHASCRKLCVWRGCGTPRSPGHQKALLSPTHLFSDMASA